MSIKYIFKYFTDLRTRQKKLIPVLGPPVLGMKMKQGESEIWFKDKDTNNHMKRSR